jgi:hypothetical protein
MIMKRFITLVLLSALVSSSFAQTDSTKYWTFKGNNSLNFSQVSFKYWSKGGENSLSLNLLMDYSLNYKKEKLSFDNNLIIGYGLTRQGEEKMKKSDDRIDFSTKLGWKVSEHWNVSGFLGFKTQFAPGYKYPERDLISRFMAPAYLLLGLGMDYRPNKALSILITPIALKTTFVNDENLVTAFGIDEGKKSRSEFGASIKAMYEQEILKNVLLNSKLELFSNYLENTKNVDVLWDIILNMKINSFLSTIFIVNMLYDDDIKTVRDDGSITGPKLQYMQLFGLGLTYNFK